MFFVEISQKSLLLIGLFCYNMANWVIDTVKISRVYDAGGKGARRCVIF